MATQDDAHHEVDESGPTVPDLAEMIMQGEQLLEALAQVHSSQWGLGTADRWDLDQEAGVITWTFPDKTATAPVQVLGSFMPAKDSWCWSWANEAIRPELCRDAETVRAWGEEHGLEVLTTPQFSADGELAGSLVALAVRLTEATGFYKGGEVGAAPIMTFGPVTLTYQDGTTDTVQVQLSGPGDDA